MLLKETYIIDNVYALSKMGILGFYSQSIKKEILSNLKGLSNLKKEILSNFL